MCSLVSYSRKCLQMLFVLWNLSRKIRFYFFCRHNDCPRFVAKKRNRRNFFFERGRFSPSKVAGRLVFLEKRFSYSIAYFVRALSREHHRHHKLERRPVFKFAFGLWIVFFQITNNST